jgi:hypothetical protein
MPEGPELENELDRVRESIEEARGEERESSRLIRRISFTTAIVAVIAAVAALEAGSTINEALLRKNEAMGVRTEAFDLWSQYQAKGIKAALLKTQRQLLITSDHVPPSGLDDEINRYQREQSEISADAKNREALAGRHAEDAEHLVHRHHRYASAVALLQISVALSAIAALSRNRALWILSLFVATAGTAAFADGFFLWL